MATKLVSVRVLPSRSLSLGERHYVAGDVLELTPAEAKALEAQGVVEKVK